MPTAIERGTDRLLLAIEGVVYLKITLVVLAFDPSAADTFALTKSAISHALTGVLVVLLGWAVATRRGVIGWSPVHLGVLAVVTSFAIATPFALDLHVAVFGAWRRYLGLLQVLDVAVLYVAAAAAFGTSGARRRLLTVSLATAVIVAGYAFVQRAGLDPVTYKDAPTTARQISSLGNPDILGAYASIASLTALGAVVLGNLWRSPPALLYLIGTAAICFAVELMVGVRAGVLGLLSACAGIGLLAAVRRPRIPAQLAAAAAIGVAIIAGVALTPIGSRLAPEFLRSDVAVQLRLEIWEASWDMVGERPLLGVGPDNFAAGYPSHRSERTAILVPGELETSTHSWFVYVLTSAGVLGGLSFLSLVVLLIWRAAVLARQGSSASIALVPALAYLGQGLVGVNDLALDWTLWLSAGVVVAADARAPAAIALLHRGRVLRPLALAAVAIATVVGSTAAMDRVNGSREAALGQVLTNEGQGAAAIVRTSAALRRDPARAELWAIHGAALDKANLIFPAVSAFREAAARAPWFPLHWRNLALVQLVGGNREAGIAALEEAARADPYDAETRDLLARLWLARGDAPRAADEGARAVRLAPGNLGAYDAPVLANLQLQRWDETQRLLDAAFARGDTPALRFRLAQLYAATGQTAEALAELERVLAEQPDHREARELAERLRAR